MNRAQRRTNARYTHRQPPPRHARRFPLIPAAIAVIVAMAVVALIVTQLQGDSGPTPGQTQDVTVSGDTLPRLPSSGDDPAVGRMAPEISGATFSGEPLTIRNDGRGKVILFLAHWCPHCQAELPRIVDWLKTNQLPAGVDLYGIATGTSEKQPNYPPQSWLEEEGWTRPTLADDGKSSAGDAMGLATYPYFVAINAQGQVVARTSGEIPLEEFQRLLTLAGG